MQAVEQRLGRILLAVLRIEAKNVSQFAYGGRSIMNSQFHQASSPARHHQTAEVPIADVLSRVGHELGHLGWLLEHLQAQIRPLIQEAVAHDGNVLHHMQNVDRIGQKATGVADFLEALVLTIPRQWLVDPTAAARTVKLAELSSRLGFSDNTSDLCSTPSGDCELF